MAITLPYTFVPRTTALSAEVNANFALLAARAVDKVGDTLTGTLLTQSLIPTVTGTYDLGSTTFFYRTLYIKTSMFLEQSNGYYNILWANPSASRTLTIDDPLNNSSFVFNNAPQTLTLKTFNFPVIDGDVTGTYNLAGNLIITSPVINNPVIESPTIYTAAVVTNVADNEGVSISATLTDRPSVMFRNATTGLLARIQATNDKGLIFYGNGESNFVAKMHQSGGMSVGSTVDPNVSGFFLTSNTIYAASQSFGVGASGNSLKTGRNISGGGSPGMLVFETKSGVNWYVWVDTSGIMRINSTPPTETTGDGIGTPV